MFAISGSLSSSEANLGTVLLNAVLVILLAGLGGFIFCILLPTLINTNYTNSLLERGQPAQATILKMREIGADKTEGCLTQFILQVQAFDRPAFRSKATSFITKADIPHFQPGEVLTVRFDPKNTKRVVISR